MDPLRELMSCCHSAELEKITERKRLTSVIYQQLKLTQVIQALDKCSENSNKTINWDIIFKFVCRIILKEADSSLSRSGKEKILHECGSLFKFFIRAAESRGPKLKTSELIKHVLQIMKDPVLSATLGNDYSTVLLKYVLISKKHPGDITQMEWQGLIDIYCSLYLEETDISILARVIGTLISTAAERSSLKLRRWLPFFIEIFKNNRRDILNHQESLLLALLAFCRSIAPDCRSQLCQLGEDIMHTLFIWWPNGSSIKESLVEFFVLQMVAHHPKGANSQELGAFACDYNIWQNHLCKLYDILHQEMTQLTNRTKFSGNKDTLVKPIFLELVAQVYHQIFTYKVDICSLVASSSKRYRLQADWNLFVDILGTSAYLWFQLLEVLLERFSTVIPKEVILEFIKTLQKILEDGQRSEIKVFRCLQLIAHNQKNLNYSGWQKIWIMTSQYLTLNKCDSEAWGLLHCLLAHGLVTPECDFLQLFSAGVPFMKSSFNVLLLCLEQFNFLNKQSKYSLRTQLLDWLLPQINDQDGQILNPVNEEDFKHLVFLLVITCFCNIKLVNHHCTHSETTWFEHLERLYLQSTFTISIFEKKKVTVEDIDVYNGVLETIRTKLVSHLEGKCKILLEICCQPQIARIESLLYLINLLIHIIHAGFRWKLWNNSITELPLHVYLEKLVKRFASLLWEYFHQYDTNKVTHLITIFKSLNQMMTGTGVVTCSLASGKLVDLLLLIMEIKVADTEKAFVASAEDVEMKTDEFIQTSTSDTLNSYEELQLMSVRILCLWCCHTEDGRKRNLRPKLFQLFNSTWDPASAYGFQLLSLQVQLWSEGTLTSQECHCLLEALRQAFKKNSKDPALCIECLQLLRHLIPSLKMDSSDDGQENRNLAIFLIAAIWYLHKESKITLKTLMALMDCLQVLLEVDPAGSWSALESECKKVTIAEAWVELLSHYSHQIRMKALLEISSLLRHQSVDYQTSSYAMICLSQSNLVNFQSKLSGHALKDEINNRTSSSLLTLANVACFPFHEKAVIYMFCQLCTKIAATTTCKVLQHLSSFLGYTSMLSYIESHIGYLIHQWLNDKQSISNFPHQLFGCSNINEFYRSYSSFLIPHLILDHDLNMIKSIANELSCNWLQLLKDCFPRILAYILPLFAAKNSEDGQVNQQQLLKASVCHQHLEEALGKQTINDLLTSNIEDVIIELLLLLQDPLFEDQQILRYPAPNPPYCSSYTIQATMDYLSECCAVKGQSAVTLLTKTPDGIQKILLSLSVHMYQATRQHEKYRLFLVYHLFVKLLLKEFSDGLGGCWAFVLRDIIYRLINEINSKSSLEKGLCCSLLQDICLTSLTLAAQEVGKHLHVIVSSLIRLVDTPLSKQALGLLKLLIINHDTKLQNFIACLDSFPQTSAFEDINKVYLKHKYFSGPFTLHQEINHFLQVGKLYPMAARLEGVRFLKQQLSSRKDEFLQLVQNSENISTCLLPLVQQLLQLSRSCKEDCPLSREVAACLGELGPINLSTIVLISNDSPVFTFDEAVKEQKNCLIFHLLNSYLTEDNVDCLQASSEVLKSLFNTKSGQAFAVYYKTHDSGHMMQYLQPFRSKKKCTKVFLPPEDCFLSTIDETSLWIPQDSDHGTWIKQLVCALIQSGAVNDEILLQLVPICQKKVDFCEHVLPFLIHDILLNESSFHRQLLSTHIQKLFHSYCQQINSSSSQSNSRTADHISSQSMRCMIEVIKYLRLQPHLHKSKSTSWDSNFWLDLDYLLLSQVAQDCAAYFTSLLFIEIWHELNKATGAGINLDCPLDQLNSTTSEKDVQTLLLKAYHYIGDPDAVYGCGSNSLSQPSTRVFIYEHERQWEKALSLYDMNHQEATNQIRLLQVMQSLGLQQTIKNCLKGYQHSELDANLIDFMYESAWRCGMWDENLPSRHAYIDFHQSLYNAIIALQDSDQFPLHLSNCRDLCIRSIRQASLESTRTTYSALSKLQCINILEEFVQFFHSNVNCMKDLLNKWELQDQSCLNEFQYLEPSCSLRCSLLELLYKKRSLEPVLKSLSQQLLKKVCLARQFNQLQLAETEIHKLYQLPNDAVNCGVQLEEAKIFWSRSEFATAKHLIRKIVTSQENSDADPVITAEALQLYGRWLAETYSESPSNILNNYFNKALDLLAQQNSKQTLGAHLTIARFADAQYKSITNYMNSTEYEAKCQLMRRAKEDLEKLRQLENHQGRYHLTLAKQSEIDEKEIEGLTIDRDQYLEKAVHHYLLCFQLGNQYDLWVFRLISLWFYNSTNEIITTEILKNINSVPSFKFLPLIYQLAARLGVKGDLFQTTLSQLIVKIAIDHPYHALDCILALSNANKDDTQLKKKLIIKKNADFEEERVTAAHNILKKVGEHLDRELLTNLQQMSDAYIELAYLKTTQDPIIRAKNQNIPQNIPKNLSILHLKHRSLIPVMTLKLKIDLGCHYENIIHVVEFGSTFSDPGGITWPKVITCTGSDGIKRRQLLKARDDLRQDAVMQQVFTVVNSLLSKNEETRQRKLAVRGYKVIPLTRCCGVVEWCEQTQPLGEYLIGSKGNPRGAHARYRPTDWPASKCREKMRNVSKKSLKEKLETFLTICHNLQPVFHHFFFENFLDPAKWFECRLAYTRSVATSSIVGYILGLGDRHVQNILIDKKTAELLHIDLGVAFEQGKILGTPETVPFRLSRDLVDGMGISGVEGVFRRCCEKTMDVMRGSQEYLLTILEVLLYDPLYVWTISPLKALKLQQPQRESDFASSLLNTDDVLQDNGPQENVNELAKRVLMRLQQKLEGIEESVVLSVSGQVTRLIEEARNPINLCRLFDGWQAFL